MPQDDKQSMTKMARDLEAHYTHPAPKSHPPTPPPFPDRVINSLVLGTLTGALVGLLFGWLAGQNLIVLPNMEQLYSLYPRNFVTFWIFVGAALGIILGGINGLLSTPVEDKM